MSPKWSPWSLCLDVMRNTEPHSASCTLSVARASAWSLRRGPCAPAAPVWPRPSLGSALWSCRNQWGRRCLLTSMGRDWPRSDVLCSVVILEQSPLHFLN